jgi:hypothetical protein
MKARLQGIAAARLAERSASRSGALAEAQEGLWQALERGDLPEMQRLGAVVRSIQGPVPASPQVEQIMKRLQRLAEYRRFWPLEGTPQ